MSTVVAQPYSTAGNGGRKLVRLSNGWEVAVTKTESRFDFFVNKNDDNGWSALCHMAHASIAIADIAIVSKGNKVLALSGRSVGGVISFVFDATTVANTNLWGTVMTVDLNQSALGNVSLTINPQGTELHAAWASKNSTQSASFGIRYAKGTISVDGSVNWSAVEQVVVVIGTNAGRDYLNPTVSVLNGIPVIAYEGKGILLAGGGANVGTSANGIQIAKRDQTLSIKGSNPGLHDNWSAGDVYRDSYAQSSPSAVVDKDGVIHVAWHGTNPSATTRNILYYSRSNDGGVTWSSAITIVPTNDNTISYSLPTITVDKSRVDVLYNHYNNTVLAHGVGMVSLSSGTWSSIKMVHPATLTVVTNPSALYDPTFAGVFGEAPPTIYQDTQAGMVKYIGTYTTNNAPTVTLNTTNNRTLYENDTFVIDGQATDSDNGNIVNVKYQINGGTVRAIATAISDGTTPISFNEQLTFKNGRLFKGATEITGALTEGTPHQLKVWSEDDKGGKSAEQVRTFYVVPNRAPVITIDSIANKTDLINSDKLAISGTTSDPDGNDVVVKYKINRGLATQIHSDPAGAWSFELSVKDLVSGENSIVVEVTDTYNFKTSKTIKLNKAANLTPLSESVQRYKIVSPSGSAQGVLLWIQRSEDLEVSAEISMTNGSEQERFVPLIRNDEDTNPNPQPAPVSPGFVEDYFKYRADALAEHIVLKLTLKGNRPITLISGALLQ